MEANGKRRAVLLGYVHTILHTALGIVYVPILLSAIGKDAYGLYQMVASVVAYFSVMESTLSAAVLRQYTMYLVKGYEAGMEHVLFLSRKMYHFLSVIIAGGALVLVPVIFFLYQATLSSADMKEFLLMYVLLIANILVSVNNYTYIACISAHERFVFLKGVSILLLLLQPIGVLALLQLIPHATVIVAVELFLNVLAALWRRYYAKKKLQIKAKEHSEMGNALMKSMLVFSVGTFLTVLADQIFWKTDQLILGKMEGTASVAVYSVGVQVFYAFMALASGVGGVLLPSVVEQIQNKGMETADSFFRKIGRIQGFILGLMVTGFIVLGKSFLELWVGPGYEEAYIVAVLLMTAYSVDIIQGTVGIPILQVVNRYNFRAKCMFAIAIVNVFLTVAFVRWQGMTGAAVATVISLIIGTVIIMNVYYHKTIGLNIKLFWKEMSGIFMLWIVCTFLGQGILFISFPNAVLTFIVRGIALVVIYLALAYCFVMNSNEKEEVKSVCRALKKR